MKIARAFIIGAPKSGTSALAKYLSERDDVAFSDPKEPLYFSTDVVRSRNEPLFASLNDYEGAFDSSPEVAIRIEGSTRYLYSADAVQNIENVFPDSRYVVMLRRPDAAAVAYYDELRRTRQERDPDFNSAWLREVRSGSINKRITDYPGFFRYGEQLQRLLSRTQRVHIIIQEEMAADVRTAYQQTLEFLGLPDDGRADFPRINERREHRLGAWASAILAPPARLEGVALWARSKASRTIRHPIVQELLYRPTQGTSISNQDAHKLQHYYAETQSEVAAILDRPITAWDE